MAEAPQPKDEGSTPAVHSTEEGKCIFIICKVAQEHKMLGILIALHSTVILLQRFNVPVM